MALILYSHLNKFFLLTINLEKFIEQNDKVIELFELLIKIINK